MVMTEMLKLSRCVGLLLHMKVKVITIPSRSDCVWLPGLPLRMECTPCVRIPQNNGLLHNTVAQQPHMTGFLLIYGFCYND